MSQMRRRSSAQIPLYSWGDSKLLRAPPKDPPCIDLISPDKGSLHRGYRAAGLLEEGCHFSCLIQMLPKTQSTGLHPLFLFSCPAPGLIFAELGSPVMACFCYQSITHLLQIEAQRNGHILHTHGVSFGFPFHITVLISSKRSSDRQVGANHHGFFFLFEDKCATPEV